MVPPAGGRELPVCSASGSSLLSARLGVLGRPSGPTRLPRRLMGPREPVRVRLVSRFTVLLRRRGAIGLCIDTRNAKKFQSHRINPGCMVKRRQYKIAELESS